MRAMWFTENLNPGNENFEMRRCHAKDEDPYKWDMRGGVGLA